MRAIVTGAGGFVGANLVRRLLERGDEPIAVVRPGGDDWRLAGVEGEVRRAEVDLLEGAAVTQLVVCQRPDVVFNLAAHGAYSWQQDFDAMLAVNVRATEALLAGAREVGARVVQAGSSSEYGFQDRAPTELDRVEPNSHYAVTKAAATHLCRLAAARYGQPAVTLRLYSAYGPWEQPGRLMPTLIEHALRGKLPPLVAPETARDFVWVEDVCDAFVRVAIAELLDPGAVFNIASGTQTTLRTLVEEVSRQHGVPGEPDWGSMSARSWDSSAWVGDPSAAARRLGWSATTSLEQGLDKLAAWMQSDSAVRARYADDLALAASAPGAGAAPARTQTE
jgi:UDP-glucose 4-epimerase